MYCSACGAKNVAENNFCRQCGHKLEKQASPVVTEEAFDRALPEDELLAALLERAYRRRKENDLASAISLCKEALDIRPESTTAHGLLGQLYELGGDRALAIQEYEYVLKLNPGSIADRVKLDELRDGTDRPQLPKRTITRVAIVDPDGAPIRGAMAWGIGLCILLVLSGVALAISLNRHDNETNRGGQPDLRVKQGIGPGSPESNNSVAEGAGPGKLQGKSGSTSTSAPQLSSGSGAAANIPTYTFPGPFAQYQPPPVQVILPAGYGSRTAPARSTIASKPSHPSTATPAERYADDGDDGARIHLSSVDGTTGADGHEVNIRIPKPDDGKGAPKSAPAQGAEPDAVAKVSPHKGAVDASASDTPSSESAAMISVGQEKMDKMDYGGAITAFRKALAGANDETAYVYAQMGQCYRDRNENKNALTMYEHGRDEYRKLISAGKQVERATSGMKLCENGIKICNGE